MRKIHHTLSRIFLCASLFSTTLAHSADVEFPGQSPGNAKSSVQVNVATLSNDVISASWRVTDDQLHPASLANLLTNQTFSQDDRELFRLATAPAAEAPSGVYVGIRLSPEKIIIQASADGANWTDITSYPRTNFTGDPKLVRLGKMNTHAQSKDNPGDLGAPGKSHFDHLVPPGAIAADETWDLNCSAHQASTRDAAFPAGTTFVSCHIDKDTDQGMSWGPALALVWEEEKQFVLVGVREKNNVLNLATQDGEVIRSIRVEPQPLMDLTASKFQLASKTIKTIDLPAEPKGVRLADRIHGKALQAELIAANGLRALWRAELRDGSNYIRQTVQFSSASATIPLYAVELADLTLPGAQSIGTVPGSPVSGSGCFVGVEMPGSRNAMTGDDVRIGFACKLEVTPQQPYAFGSVVGVASEGQLRRSFLYYVERERARPSKPFLHYNCWYDLGFNVNEKAMLDVVESFTRELVKKRGVPVQSYLVDDGWDDVRKGLWAESPRKFPTGFAGLNEKMSKMGAHLSIWISPLGGYGGNEERTKLAQKMNLIPEGTHLDLSQPGYKKWFTERCLTLMREDGVNAFKWDKAGEGVSPHFMALLDVARTLRKQNPEVFINVTVGTWPSPFWLNHIDSTWRNGSGDVAWEGKGDDREKWLTFRDGYCHRLFVNASPIYPLNSVMHHGIVHGRQFQGERVGKAGTDLKNEARSYFANGASLQELYLTPSMMTDDGWDRVAEAAKWAHANADVLVDAHWVGGDPLKLQPYGYAAWNARKGTLMLRNPSDQAQEITIDAQSAFDLPAGATQAYELSSPYKDQRLQKLSLIGTTAQTVSLQPFEVLVFDAMPQK